MPEHDELDSDEQRAQELLARSHPKHRETEELQEELSAVWDLITDERVTADPLNRLFDRSEVIFRVLKDRLNIEYPECERCGARSWGQEPGYPLHCASCDLTPDEEVREQVHEKWRQISGDTGAEA